MAEVQTMTALLRDHKTPVQLSGMIRVLKSLLITVNSSYNELNEKLCILLCNCDNEITEALST